MSNSSPKVEDSRRLRSPPNSPADGPLAKRPRTGSGATNSDAVALNSSENVNPKPERLVVQGLAPSAMKLLEAMKAVKKLTSIGYCQEKVVELSRHMLSYNGYPDTRGVELEPRAMKNWFKRDKHNGNVIVKMSEVLKKHAKNSAEGYFDKPFALRITRAGCEFDGSLTPQDSKKVVYHSVDRPQAETEALNNRLKQWYDHATVSGYGDVREQVTKVDSSVRAARDIPASEFSVEPELLQRIADLWDQNFFPNTGTVVEPYKIHLYGPGGHFKLHRDTPAKDLVGTFLLGLGDTSNSRGLKVDGRNVHAHEGSWCAFYPDVPHSVEHIYEGYRAVIAFKLFRTPGSAPTELTPTSKAVCSQVTELMGKMRRPFGIMLERKYCLGTTEFSGFDALLLESAREKYGEDAWHLPVVLQTTSTWGGETDDDFEARCEINVYPFTRAHIDSLSQDVVDQNYIIDEADANLIKQLEDGRYMMPFFSLDLARSLYVYKTEEQETVNYVGNEAQAWREDSVYLSYALIVLGKDAQPISSDSEEAGENDEEIKGTDLEEEED